MKAGNKIALFYTAITMCVVIAVTGVFYLIASGYIDRLYFSYLTEKAYVTAYKHWEQDELDEESYARVQELYDETMPLATEILLDADDPDTQVRLKKYLSGKEITGLYNGEVIRFNHSNLKGTAIYYPDNEGNFIVIILSANQYGADIRTQIGWMLLITVLVSGVLIWLVGKLYASRMVDRIDAAYKSEKDFISHASHELNNPLTAIQGECEITLLKDRTPEEYQSAMKRIAHEANRIIQLMRHLLFLSHGEEEILKNAQDSIMLADFMMQFVNSRIRFSPDNFSFSVQANPHLFKTAIKNIINNALKYSDDKPVEITLRHNVLTITDQGIGIPKQELERIRQPFYRATNTREYPGHGVGLSLSVRILAIYGAEVRVESSEGVGTSVIIEF